MDDEQRRKKAKKLYGKLENVQNRDDTGRRPTGVATRYQLNKKFTCDITVEEPVKDPTMVGGVLAIKRLATRGNEQVAAMISLRTTAEGGKGVDIPTLITHSRSIHATGRCDSRSEHGRGEGDIRNIRKMVRQVPL